MRMGDAGSRGRGRKNEAVSAFSVLRGRAADTVPARESHPGVFVSLACRHQGRRKIVSLSADGYSVVKVPVFSLSSLDQDVYMCYSVFMLS